MKASVFIWTTVFLAFLLPARGQESTDNVKTAYSLMVLGVAQDAGYPQAECKKSCCAELWDDKAKRKMVSALGIRDEVNGKVYLFDATPDIKDQLRLLKLGNQDDELAGVFLTHAHIGHYTGLMYLGREAINSDRVPTYVMPRLAAFLKSNGPWDNLIKLENLALIEMTDGQPIALASDLVVTPLLVPHRDEYSETVGYQIKCNNKQVLFIPDIDKWSKWEKNINTLITEVDYAFLDGTFYRNGEIWGRDMSQIPHPFIEESMKQFDSLPESDKKKIHFIHLNHTNPLLDENSKESIEFRKTDYLLAKEGQVIRL